MDGAAFVCMAVFYNRVHTEALSAQDSGVLHELSAE